MQHTNTYKVLGRKPEGKRPLVRPRHRWNDIIKIDTNGIGWEDAGWIHFDSQGPVVGSCELGNELSGSIRLREILEQLSDCQILKKDSAS